MSSPERVVLVLIFLTIVGCGYIGHVQAYKPEAFPNPQTDVYTCGHPQNEKGWICDPDSFLSGNEVMRINSMLSNVQLGSKCACGGTGCEKSFVVSVAIVKEIENSGWKPAYTIAQDFANHLRDVTWRQHGDCDENIVIVYDVQNDIISTAFGWRALGAVASECNEYILEETREYAKRKQIFEALSSTIQGYAPFLGGQKTCQGRPNTATAMDQIYVAWIVIAIVFMVGIIYLILLCFRRKGLPEKKMGNGKRRKRPVANVVSTGNNEAGALGSNHDKHVSGKSACEHCGNEQKEPSKNEGPKEIMVKGQTEIPASAQTTVNKDGIKISNLGGITILEMGSGAMSPNQPTFGRNQPADISSPNMVQPSSLSHSTLTDPPAHVHQAPSVRQSTSPILAAHVQESPHVSQPMSTYPPANVQLPTSVSQPTPTYPPASVEPPPSVSLTTPTYPPANVQPPPSVSQSMPTYPPANVQLPTSVSLPAGSQEAFDNQVPTTLEDVAQTHTYSPTSDPIYSTTLPSFSSDVDSNNGQDYQESHANPDGGPQIYSSPAGNSQTAPVHANSANGPPPGFFGNVRAGNPKPRKGKKSKRLDRGGPRPGNLTIRDHDPNADATMVFDDE